MKKKLYEITKISFERAEDIEEAKDIARSQSDYIVLEVREVEDGIKR